MNIHSKYNIFYTVFLKTSVLKLKEILIVKNVCETGALFSWREVSVVITIASLPDHLLYTHWYSL